MGHLFKIVDVIVCGFLVTFTKSSEEKKQILFLVKELWVERGNTVDDFYTLCMDLKLMWTLPFKYCKIRWRNQQVNF